MKILNFLMLITSILGLLFSAFEKNLGECLLWFVVLLQLTENMKLRGFIDVIEKNK